jgi:hypothetical protein
MLTYQTGLLVRSFHDKYFWMGEIVILMKTFVLSAVLICRWEVPSSIMPLHMSLKSQIMVIGGWGGKVDSPKPEGLEGNAFPNNNDIYPTWQVGCDISDECELELEMTMIVGVI